MSDFPIPVTLPNATVHPWSAESIGRMLGATSGSYYLGSAVSAVYISANLAIFVPFSLTRPVRTTLLWTANGAAVSGNMDVGVYDENGVKLISTGAIAQAGVSTLQTFVVASTQFGPGRFYLALSHSDAIGRYYNAPAPAITLKMAGVLQMAAAHPLPATANFATMAFAYLPAFGFVISPRTVI